MKNYLNTFKSYNYPFGCGTVALYNCLHFYGKVSNHSYDILGKIAKELKEKDQKVLNKQMGKVLDNYFSVNHEVAPYMETVLNHLDSDKILIILHYNAPSENDSVGHFIFMYGSKHLAYEGKKIIYKDELNKILSKKCKTDDHPCEVWFLDKK